MDSLQVTELIEHLLAEYGQKALSPAERLVIIAAWEDRTYSEVAAGTVYKTSHLQRAYGARFWRRLSRVMGQGVGKKNFKHVMSATKHAETLGGQLKRPHLRLLGANVPDLSHFYGRAQELKSLEHLIDNYHCVALVGVEGIGKRSLAFKLQGQLGLSFEQTVWRSVQHKPSPLQLVNEMLQVLGALGEDPCTEDLAVQLAKLLLWLQKSRYLLVLDGVDALLKSNQFGDKWLPEGFLNVFRRIIEETSTRILILSQEPISQLDLRSELDAIHYALEGLAPTDAKQIFAEAQLKDEHLWESVIAQMGGHPMLLRQFALKVKARFGGSVKEFAGYTLNLGLVQSWFDDVFRDPGFLTQTDRRVLVDLANLIAQMEPQRPIELSKLVLRTKASEQSLERLLQSSLVSKSFSEKTQEQLISLNPLIQKYLLRDPCGFVKAPVFDQSSVEIFNPKC